VALQLARLATSSGDARARRQGSCLRRHTTRGARRRSAGPRLLWARRTAYEPLELPRLAGPQRRTRGVRTPEGAYGDAWRWLGRRRALDREGTPFISFAPFQKCETLNS
jgi:hypothetical protein